MFKSLKRTFTGPSRDPRMLAYIARPMPRDLLDEDVVAALDIALAANPDPRYLVETLPPALRQVTGRNLEVVDRSVADVTDSYSKTMVMIRDGDVGLWPGFAARSYPLIRPTAKTAETAAIIEGDAAAPKRKPGWEPPAPLTSRVRASGSAAPDRGVTLLGQPGEEH
jgi:hypothetical protein